MQNMLNLCFTQQVLDAPRELQISRLSSMEEIKTNKQTNKSDPNPSSFFLTWPHMLTHINWGTSLE